MPAYVSLGMYFNFCIMLLCKVRKLLEHGADILQPVKVRDEWGPGTVADFAHEAFKQASYMCTVYTAFSM